MTDQQWDDFESGKEVSEQAQIKAENSIEQRPDSAGNAKSRMTDLRRRIEERLESKRIALEYDYLMLEEFDPESEHSHEHDEGSEPLQ